PNGVENNFTAEEFEKYIEKKDFKDIHILYLSNMIKSKGYFEVLKLAKLYSDQEYMFHFAGGWQSKEDEKEFFAYIKENKLEKRVTFYGFVNGIEKKELFEKASLFVFPTRYKNEAFPLSILEAFSYGIPVLSTNEGSISDIVDSESGVIIFQLNDLSIAFQNILKNFVNKNVALYCRKKYLNSFSLEKFENNFINCLKK
ncbi:MAG TPA: glycosyltransferase, partial [Arcobacter sp.]|nr:glycosyltransferase [Arcobacter sp.]